MVHYLFTAVPAPGAVPASIDALLDRSAFIFAVVLAGEDELRLLTRLLRIDLPAPPPLAPPHDFSACFDLSAALLPRFTPAGFDTFFEAWLQSTGRPSTMDEYGQLLFLQGHAGTWNRAAGRFILRERS